jgi:hypothetical protein
LVPEKISKTAPLHTFCIHLLWGLRVFTSTDMVQLSPQLNCVSGGITLSKFRRWRLNPTALHRCMFAECFNTWLEFLLYQENWSSPVAGIELQVPGCGMQAAATQQCAIIFCALSSRSVLFHVFYCVMNFLLLWDSCTLCGRNCDCLNGPTELSAALVLPASLWSHFYCQSVILCLFSYTNIILDDHSASLISFPWLPTFLILLNGPQNER